MYCVQPPALTRHGCRPGANFELGGAKFGCAALLVALISDCLWHKLIPGAGETTRAHLTNSKLGITGKGIHVAVIDTGEFITRMQMADALLSA